MSRITDTVARHRRALAEREDASVARLHRAHLTILDALYDDLDAVTALIEEAIANGQPVNIDWLRRQERYHRLIEQTQAAYAQYEPVIHAEVVSTKQDALQRARTDAMERAEALGLRTQTMYATLNTEALTALTGALSPDSPLRAVISSHGPRAVEVIERELVAGMGRGSGAHEMVRSIRRQLGGEADVSRLRALVRTEMMRSYRESLFQQYTGMGFTHWRWSAALSKRTCLACISMHGKLFPMKDAFMPAHVCCRCSPQPAYADSRMVGPTGDEWFARQDADVQRRMIGNRDAFDAYRNGQLKLDDFRAETDHPVWGRSVYQKSGKSALQGMGGGSAGSEVIRFNSKDEALSFFEDTLGVRVGGRRSLRDPNSPFVNREGSIETWETVANVLNKERLAGRPLPAQVNFNPYDPKERELASYAASFKRADTGRGGALNINAETPFWADDAAYQSIVKRSTETNWVLTPTREGTLYHELGHHYHWSKNPTMTRGFEQVEVNGRVVSLDTWTGGQREIAERVSRYGASRPSEFVAEVYRGLRTGVSFDDEVMDLYRAFGGPNP